MSQLLETPAFPFKMPLSSTKVVSNGATMLCDYSLLGPCRGRSVHGAELSRSSAQGQTLKGLLFTAPLTQGRVHLHLHRLHLQMGSSAADLAGQCGAQDGPRLATSAPGPACTGSNSRLSDKQAWCHFSLMRWKPRGIGGRVPGLESDLDEQIQ